ncbi:hypothetical protein X943_001296 [Babesia divergens]|uniref:Iron-binding zinc finger CDGSH type domain-containing protein n=1 Tax=Babesia divergens TaxID=32595 RepID=A0AAD9LJD0_BABDI|nr:hypothetical protein X943_001296 [Babesia divergens]
MSDPLEYYETLDFNTRHQPLYSHVIERFPKTNEPDAVIRICRCWQSRKFPYCDDTHKLLVENGDDVGPYVVRLRSEKSNQRNVVKIRQPINRRATSVYTPPARVSNAKLVPIGLSNSRA